MCGISGYIDFKNKLNENSLLNMVKSLKHRGPDDIGHDLTQLDFCTIGLAHARLSIIDLSPGGHQPMLFNHLKIVFNGEIYNFKEIRKDLEELGHCFKSSSDTEVILHAFQEWGKECVNRFIGMFAICIFDKIKNTVIFIRDRAGVKPLYYYWKEDLFLFASELKAFFTIPEFKKEIDTSSLLSYFEYGYVPSPYSIFKNCFKLQAGHWLEVDLGSKQLKEECYWDIEQFYIQPKYNGDYNEAKEDLKEILISAGNYRMVADVPVGVFLSGGYDSAGIAAMIQKGKSEKLRTYTIGFEEGNNEAPYAKLIAEYLGTNHTEYYCSEKESQDIISEMPYFYDEPFADSSAIPTTLVSRIAKKEVSVALSADGGDEIFCGYNVYHGLKTHLGTLSRIPNAFKSISAGIAKITGTLPVLNERQKSHFLAIGNSLNKDVWTESADLFRIIQGLPLIYNNNIIKENLKIHYNSYSQHNKKILSSIEHAMAKDFKMYLQDDILTKVDRATMSVSLEGREPLLDQRIIEFTAKLPLHFKYDGIKTKRIYKDIVHDFIPKSMLDRPKAGFSIPIFSWLRNDLSYLLEEYLNEKALAESGLLNVDFNKKQVELFKVQKLYYPVYVWRLLMFQMWYFYWMKDYRKAFNQ
jgi:asparagine synthase (glutamine-hydrolysing)